jgi:type ISP restriction-modification system protein
LQAFFPPPDWDLGPHLKHLYNPYVYFWRWATWKVFEHHPSDRGVVALITVAGFLNGPGFAGMRAYLRRTADAIWVIDLSPEGHQPEVPTRVFAGVQQPVCITIAIRDGTTGEDTPAPVLHHAISGLQQQKFKALSTLELGGDGWAACPTRWGAPFLPASGASWEAMPALGDLMPWSGSGTMAGRTWVVAPLPETLRARWRRLVSASADDKRALFQEHPRDRPITKVLRDGLPGFPASPGAIADEAGPCPDPVRVGYRSFDRQWLIPDKRLINQPNPSLWASRSDRQIFLTGLEAHSPTSGPAVTFSALVPDLHHYRGSFGGRVFPLWRDALACEPNVAPGLLDHLDRVVGIPVRAHHLLAYLACVVAQPAYTARFARALATPGLRVPLTAQAMLFTEAVVLGSRVVWLHTYGERFADPADGRTVGPPRLPDDRRPKVTVAIPDDPARMPEDLRYDADTRTLQIGEGRIAPVPPEVWSYEVSGVNVLRKWFGYRKPGPEGRRVSALDAIVAESWPAQFTTELLELLNVLGLLSDVHPLQAELLERILDGPLVDVDDLTAAGVLPVPPKARKPPTVPDADDSDARMLA